MAKRPEGWWLLHGLKRAVWGMASCSQHLCYWRGTGEEAKANYHYGFRSSLDGLCRRGLVVAKKEAFQYWARRNTSTQYRITESGDKCVRSKIHT
jgi:hypothetical protein